MKSSHQMGVGNNLARMRQHTLLLSCVMKCVCFCRCIARWIQLVSPSASAPKSFCLWCYRRCPTACHPRKRTERIPLRQPRGCDPQICVRAFAQLVFFHCGMSLTKGTSNPSPCVPCGAVRRRHLAWCYA